MMALWMALAAFTSDPAHAQSAGVHAVAGAFAGRYTQADLPDSDLVGARLGVGVGELLQINGFYWRTVNVEDREFTANFGWGGESRLALNAGFGVTPFLTGGLGRVEREATEAETVAIAGAGLMIPLGPVIIEASVQDYILGISAFNDSDEVTETTHNWLYSGGVTMAIGPRRRAARSPAPPPPPAPSTQRDPAATGTQPDRAESPAQDVQRNYHSERSIQVPIPVEGSITLRYGPEPEPVTVTGTENVGSPAAAGITDADLELMLRRIVADEVTSRLATSPMIVAPGATGGAGGATLSEARVQQIVDRTVAALLPRLEASQSQQMNALRTELSAALNQQSAALRTGLVAPQPQPAPVVPVAPAQPTQPSALPPVATPAAAAGESPRPQVGETTVAPSGPTREARLTELRSRLAQIASQQAGLGVVETDRGPGLSLPGQIFAHDQALPGPGAGEMVAAIARLASEMPGVLVFVQGHASPGRSEVSAQALSELRAEAIRSLVVQAGVEPTRVHAIGYGAARPLTTGTRAEDQAMNRRVEIVLVPRPIL